VLGSGIWVSVSFQIIPRPVGRLGSVPRVEAGRLPPGVFSVGGCLWRSCLHEGYLLEFEKERWHDVTVHHSDFWR